ncbi:MAG: DUF177 domain-containing protein [Synergistaceae bacterium]|nr:DUF177 domain-containing protein [Synergistaceae bacterium]
MNSVKAPPGDWDCKVLLSRIPKNGEPCHETFELALDAPIEHWGQEYAPDGLVIADARFASANERILAVVSVRAAFRLPCSRCLRETGVEAAGELKYLFSLRPARDSRDTGGESAPEEDGDVDVIQVDSFQAELDVTQCVWEALLLSLPEGALCKPGCKGLCPICGRDRNEGDCGCRDDDLDPRLAVLRDLDV